MQKIIGGLIAGLVFTIIGSAQTFSITTSSLGPGTQGNSFNQTLMAANATGSVAWTITSGTLPAGLSLDSSTGAITGTPTVIGAQTFTVMATDSASHTASQTPTLTINRSTQVSYVVVNEDSGGLVQVSADGSTVTTIAASASGYDVAQDAGGDFIVANVSSLLRVTPAGDISTIAATPSGSAWLAVAIDGNGNFIVADNDLHQLWIVSPDGSVVQPITHYPAPAENAEDVKVIVDVNGNYIVANDNSGVVVTRISPVTISNGAVTGTPVVTTVSLSGEILPQAVGGLTFDQNGNYILEDYSAERMFQIAPSGDVTVLGSLSGGPLGLARNPLSNELVTGGSGSLEVLPAGGTETMIGSSGLIVQPEGIVAVTSDFVSTVDATSPLAYFRLQDTSGLSEVNGYTYNFSATGAAVGVANGVPINETSDYASLNGSAGKVNTSLSGNISTAGSMMAWVNLAALPSSGSEAFQYVMGESTVGNDFDVQFTSNNTLNWFTTDSGQNLGYTPNPNTLAGQWHMIVVTVNATTSSSAAPRAIYWDGTLVNSDTPNMNCCLNKPGNFEIGESDVFGSRFFNGGIGEVAIWNYALTPAQVYRMYASSAGNFASPSSPEITNVNPNISATNTAINLTITGTGLSGSSAVWFTPDGGQTSMFSPSSVSATQVTASIPSNAPGLGSSGTVQIAVANASGVPSNELPLTLGFPTLSISQQSLPAGTQGQPYSTSLTAMGGSGTGYTWSVSDEDEGLNLSFPNPSVGTLSGTPTSSNTDGLCLSITVTDSASNMATQHYCINVSQQSVMTGPQPGGTTVYVLNEKGSLLSVTGGVASTIAELGEECSFCSETALDASGNFVIATGFGITVISPSGSIVLSLSAGAITGSESSNFFGVAVDGSGNYIVADVGLQKLLRIPPGNPSAYTTIGSWTLPEGFTAEDAHLRIDASGNYILATDASQDSEQNGEQNVFQLYVINPSTNGASLTPLTISPATTEGPVPQATGGLTFDANGNYIDVDWFNEEIFKITPAGVASVLFNGNGVFEDPEGIAFDAATGNYFVVDDDKDALYTLTANGSTLTQIVSGEAFSGGPISVIVADTTAPGTLTYVLDDIDSDTPVVLVPVGGGTTLACSACSGFPVDLALDSSRNFVVATNSSIANVPRNNSGSTLNLNVPEGSNFASVAVDTDGGYVVADNSLHQILKYSATGGTSRVPLWTAPYTVSQDGEDEEDVFVRVDGAGNHIVAEDNAGSGVPSIYSISPSGGTVTPITLSGAVPNDVYLGGMTFDVSGNYILTDSDSEDIYKITPQGVVSILFNNSSNVLSEPTGIYRDPVSGNFFVTDDDDDQLFSINPAGTQITLVQGNFSEPISVITVPLSVTAPSISSLSPNSATAGGAGFTLTVNGSAFVSGAVVQWNGTPLTTIFVSASQVTASVPAPLIASAGSAGVTITNPGGSPSAAATFAIAASGPPVTPTPLVISGSGSLGEIGLGSSVSASYTASGGQPPYTWSITSAALSGVTINPQTGVLTGTPQSPGNYFLYVGVNDSASASGSLRVTLNVMGITTSTLSAATSGQPYTQAFAAAGGTGTYTFSSTNAPAGLAFSGSTLSGTPATAGTFTFQVRVTDGSGVTSTSSFTLVIAAGPLSITSSGNLGEIAFGANVKGTLTATGGKQPYTWSATGLPAGVTLNASSGALGGSPSQPGNYSFTAQVADAETPPVTKSTTVTLQVLGLTTSATLPAGSTTTPYSQALSAAGGAGSYTFSSPNLPAGLSLSGAVLSGTPSTVGTYSFTVNVSDGSGVTSSATLSLVVTGPSSPLSVTGGALTGGTSGTSYSQTLTATGGAPAYTWSITGGTLPPGLSLNGSTGTISGTPSAPGTFTFTAQAADTAKSSSSGVFTITIAPVPLTLSGLPLPNGIVNLQYPLQVLDASGGIGPYTFSISSGSLPAGLALASGQISGTPTASGTSSFTLTVTDSGAPAQTVKTPTQIVISPAGVPNLLLSAASLSFNLAAGSAGLPVPYSVTVQSSVPQTSLNYSVATTPAVSWLDVTAGSTTPGGIGIALDPSAVNLGATTTPLATGVVVTCLAPSPCAGMSQTIGVSLSVTTPSPQLTFLTSLVSFTTTASVTTPISQQVAIQNIGGGSALISSATAADNWLTLSGVPASVPAGSPVNITFTANPAILGPGFFRTTVTIQSSGGTISIPVTLNVAQVPTIILSDSGATFQSILGNVPANDTGSFQVSESGGGTVNFSAAVLPGAPWLLLQSFSTATGAVNYSIDPVASAALTPAKAYYGAIQITASGVTNSPQNYLVVLNVAPATTLPAPDPEPAGLIFQTTLGASAPPPQTVTVYSTSAGAVTYSASASTISGGSWLSVSPGTGSSSSSSPGASSVSVAPGTLEAGVYTGSVSYQFSAAAVRTVNVTLIIAPTGGTAPASSPGTITSSITQGCTPTQLVPTQTGLVSNFAQPTSWPTPLSIGVVNNCGASIANGQVVATFSNGDPPLALGLVNAAAGVYSGTWTPRSTSSQVTVTATATAPGFNASVARISGEVVANAAPVLATGGTLHIYDPQVGGALGQGTILQIYGSNLGASPMVPSTVPLPTTLGGTSVIIGGIPAPLYYVSSGQIDAQLPIELTPGNNYQVIVNANGALSTPNTIQLSAATPGIAAFASGQIVAQHPDYSLVSETSPAAPGEYLVIYLSGLGMTGVSLADGAASPDPANLQLLSPVIAPTLTLNGTSIPIYFSGLSPGYVGLYQMNFQVPPNTPNGDAQLVVSQSGQLSNSTILPVHN